MGDRSGWKRTCLSLVINDSHKHKRSAFIAYDDLPLGPLRGTSPLILTCDRGPFNTDARRCLDMRLGGRICRSDGAGDEQ